MMQILEKYQTIHDLEQSKINLDEYRDLQKKLEADSWRNSIQDHMKSSDTFEFTKRLNVGDIFKGYGFSTKLTAITIPSKSITIHHNTLILHLDVEQYWSNKVEKRTEEKKYVKGEKVYELLKDGGWNVKQETK